MLDPTPAGLGGAGEAGDACGTPCGVVTPSGVAADLELVEMTDDDAAPGSQLSSMDDMFDRPSVPLLLCPSPVSTLAPVAPEPQPTVIKHHNL